MRHDKVIFFIINSASSVPLALKELYAPEVALSLKKVGDPWFKTLMKPSHMDLSKPGMFKVLAIIR